MSVLETAAAELFASPLDGNLQRAFVDAVMTQRESEAISGEVDPIGSTYPRTGSSTFSHAQIIQALAYGIVTFGSDRIDWGRLTTAAFRPEGGAEPAWVEESGTVVEAGRIRTIPDWRKARIADQVNGYVSRFDANLSLPIASYGLRGTRAGHPKDASVEVQIDQQGFPVFEPAVDILMPFNCFSISDQAQFDFCNKSIVARVRIDPAFGQTLRATVGDAYDGSGPRYGRPPKGWVWHHHQDAGRMQLVSKPFHDAVSLGKVKHTGGAAIWGADHRHKPRDAKTSKNRLHIYKTFFTIKRRDRKPSR